MTENATVTTSAGRRPRASGAGARATSRSTVPRGRLAAHDVIDTDLTTTDALRAPEDTSLRRDADREEPQAGTWAGLLLLDALVLVFAVVLASVVTTPRDATVAAVARVTPPVWLGAMALRGLYGERRTSRTRRAVAATEAGLLASAVLAVVSDLTDRSVPATWYAVVLGTVVAGVVGVRELEAPGRRDALFAIRTPRRVELATVGFPMPSQDTTWTNQVVSALSLIHI